MTDDIEKLFIDDEYERMGIIVKPAEPLQDVPDLSMGDAYKKAITDPLAGTTMAAPEAFGEVASGLTKGLVQAGIGTIPDLIGLTAGLLDMIGPGDWAQLEQQIKNPGQPPTEPTLGEKFAAGFGGMPWTSDKIAKSLENIGWKKPEGPAQAAELIGEIGAPVEILTKAVKTIIKKVK